MTGMTAGIRRLCVAYDVECYSGRGTRREYATQERLTQVLDFAFSEAGLAADDYEMQPQGDGGIALLPTGGTVDEPRLIVTLLNNLRIGLHHLNEDLVERARLRLRLGLGIGVVHRAAHGFVGPVVIEVCRLRDADVVREKLADSHSVMVAAVTDDLYRDVLAHSYHGLPDSAFVNAEVTIKGFTAMAWLYLPPPARPERPAQPTQPARPAPAPVEKGNTSGRSALAGFLETDPDMW